MKSNDEEKHFLLKEITAEKHAHFMTRNKLEEETANLQATLKQLNALRESLKKEREDNSRLKESLDSAHIKILKYEKVIEEETEKNLKQQMEVQKMKINVEANPTKPIMKTDNNEESKLLEEEREKNKKLEEQIEKLRKEVLNATKLRDVALRQLEEEKLNVELGNVTIANLQNQIKRLKEAKAGPNPKKQDSPQTNQEMCVIEPKDDLEKEFEFMMSLNDN